jgi:hypothetical protein
VSGWSDIADPDRDHWFDAVYVNAKSKHLPAAIDKIPLKTQAFLHRSGLWPTRDKVAIRALAQGTVNVFLLCFVSFAASISVVARAIASWATN